MKDKVYLRREKIKKILCVTVTATVLVFFVSACESTGNNKDIGTTENGKGEMPPKVQIVTTVFPLFDWINAIVGEDPDFQVTLLADSGVDFHSFQPSTEDIMKIEKSDYFVYIGGTSDQWVKKIVEEQSGHGGKSISMVETLAERVKTEDEESGETAHNHGDSSDETHSEEIDEHLWLSLKNAKFFVEKISQTLSEYYPEKEEMFAANSGAYIQKIDGLDKQYQETVDSGMYKAVVVGDRFPFRYLFDDYNLQYFAAFPGCSSESEGSFEKIIWLAQKTDSLGVKKIIAIEDSKQTICNSIIENTEKKDQSVVVMNSMQQVSMKDIERGENYLKIMEENLVALSEALN